MQIPTYNENRMEIDKIYNMDCLEGMRQMQAESVDLVVTSPPYDNLRTYGGIGDGWNFDKFKAIAAELARVLKDGGVMVWVVADATIDGSETGTSFRQALYFKDECGLNIHDTMLYRKQNPIPQNHNRYEQCFEYMFVFSKGKPATFNPIMVKAICAGEPDRAGRNTDLDSKQCRKSRKGKVTADTKQHDNIFEYPIGGGDTGHPAVFPMKLAEEMVWSWSQEGDTVLDPFIGSGTTAVACIKEKRHFIGFELNKQYYDKACQRISAEQRQLTLF